jgi:hypothetical protein
VWRFNSTRDHAADFKQHTEVKSQDMQDMRYTPRLFVENVETQLQRKDHRTWTPAQRLYVPFFPLRTQIEGCVNAVVFLQRLRYG